MNILIIAGHGAGDPGASGNGFYEADLTRIISEKIMKKVSEYSSVLLFPKDKNMFKHLKAGEKFDFSPFDYVLEVHFNAGISEIRRADGNTTGTEILIHEKKTNIRVEEEILKNMEALGFRNRGIKRRNNLQNMNVIQNRGIEYSLLEVCFIDDSDDMRIYKEKTDLIAEAVSSGIKKGFGITEELVTVNDIVWELSHRGIITDKDLWLKKLSEDTNAYWLARKAIKYIMNI